MAVVTCVADPQLSVVISEVAPSIGDNGGGGVFGGKATKRLSLPGNHNQLLAIKNLCFQTIKVARYIY